MQPQTAVTGQIEDRFPPARLRRRMTELMSSFCHRSLVAERLLERVEAPMRVLHLTGPMTGRVVRPTLVPA